MIIEKGPAAEAWAHDSLTRADLQTLLGVEKARAVQLMHAWGATRAAAAISCSRKAPVLRRFKALRRGRQLVEEEQGVERLYRELAQARVSRVRVKVDRAVFGARLVGLPAGVSVERGRIVVEFRSARQAIEKLFALAQALPNDWERFEALNEGWRTRRDVDGASVSIQPGVRPLGQIAGDAPEGHCMPDERIPAPWQHIAESLADRVTEVAFEIANVIIDGSPSERRQLAQAPWVHEVGVADCTRGDESYLLTIAVQLVHETRPPAERKLRIVRGNRGAGDGAAG